MARGAILPQQTMAAPIHKYPLCDFSNVLSCGHNKLWLPCMRSSPRGPILSTSSYNGVTRRGSHTKERFSYKVNAYLYQYKRVYQECMNHYKLWLQVSVTKTHAYKANLAAGPITSDADSASLHRCALLRNSYCAQRCYTTTTNYGYPHPQRPSL